MQRRHWIHTATTIALGYAMQGLAAAQSQPRLRVVTSFSILGDLVQQVAGDRATVRSLIGPDGHAHAFEPRPSHVKSILEAKLLVLNGLHFEPWADRLAHFGEFKGEVVVVTDGMPGPAPNRKQPGNSVDTHSVDPHAWQNPRNVIHYVQMIADALCRIDPGSTPHYRAKASAYQAQLLELDKWIEAQFKSLKPAQRRAITSHQAFAYFAERYQIQFLAPQGLSSESRPSAQAVARLIKLIKAEGIQAVFLEHLSDNRLVQQIARDTGLTPGPRLFVDALTSKGGGAESYLQMMRHNTTALALGMQKN